MSIKELKNKNIAVLGLGVENIALIDYIINKKTECNISVFDSRDEKALGNRYLKYKKNTNVFWNLGKQKYNYSDFDIIFRSPGWTLFDEEISKAQKNGVVVSSPMKMFFETCPSKNIIGVTGTKGKGTTSTLIYQIIKEAGKRVWLGGNIGNAPFEFVTKIKKDDWVVLELSSFQLEDLDQSPKVAVFTNFYKEHLSPADPNNPNYHKSLAAYWLAKKNIFAHQRKSDKFIANIKVAKRLEKEPVLAERIFFHKSDIESGLIGEHNKENIAAAVEVAKVLKISKEVVRRAVKKYMGLEHRIELAGKIDNVEFYNDSFATTPEATITALKSFKGPIIALAGGADKGANFLGLARELKKRVKYIILFNGKGSTKIKKELLKVKYPFKKISFVGSMEEAFKKLKKIKEDGDVVLLSTACASFGVFKNYKERGEKFKKEIEKLK
ncbi:UDP-N-acetylmuramoyl-L-alanine--D-glutamate ligase [Candidatus Parcubacteria bacterium]|nr:MAG: UDP-N-acetylmuramoyl-L-alanine--D-glutamate ligase [Candidatus Parcubacteria bacterium]